MAFSAAKRLSTVLVRCSLEGRRGIQFRNYNILSCSTCNVVRFGNPSLIAQRNRFQLFKGVAISGCGTQYSVWFVDHTSAFSTFNKNDNLIDLKTRRPFLKRSKAENVRPTDLYIGSTVNVLARQLTFVEFGDDYTKRHLQAKNERTLGLIKPECISEVGPILYEVSRSGFSIANLRMCRLGAQEATEFYAEHTAKGFFSELVSYMTSGNVIAMELMGEGAVLHWRDVLGPTDPSVARKQFPSSLRSRFGTDKGHNACHGSDSQSSAARELEFFFPSNGGAGASRQSTALFKDSTCCVVKPHAVLDGQLGSIVTKIMDEGFQITAMQMFHLEKANAEEFLEVYRGVVQEYPTMVAELVSGPCVALEVRAENAAATFREFCGPVDPEIARHLRPRTLRALFGKSKVENAVHCTDLPEDALLEVEYFFKILNR